MKRRFFHIKTIRILSCIAVIIITGTFTGCKKALDIGPAKTLVNAGNVFSSNGTAQAAVAAIYANMASSSSMSNGMNSLTVQQGLAADEFNYSNTTPSLATQFYTNALSSQAGYYWSEIFTRLFSCNSAVVGLTSPSAETLSPSIKQQLLGEVKFARAFTFFNAVNLYGDIPMVLGTDPVVNNSISRSPATTVLNQVIQDLTDAQALLPDNSYITLAGAASTSRILPNKQATSALLARVYLYMQDWKNAELQSSNVISASSYLLEPVLTNVFLKTSREAIWQLQSISTTAGNADADALIMTGVPNALTNNIQLSSGLVNAFESDDKRLSNWVGTVQSGTTTYYYAYKYKLRSATANIGQINEYPIMFRLAEQYLIRSEARAKQGNVAGAVADLNTIRARARQLPTSLPDYPATISNTDLITAIYHERQIELFAETGHRWFDLKRTGRLDAVMAIAAPIKGTTWAPYKALVPIPLSEILINSHLTQNPGYN